MAFNFNITGVPTAHVNKSLSLWDIHDVTFDGMEIREVKGKENNTFKMIDLKFKNDSGTAVISFFWPNEKSFERREFDGANGGKRYSASNAEELWEALKQAVAALSPKGFEKLQAAAAKFKSFDEAIKACSTILSKCVGQQTQIKLGGYFNQAGYKQTSLPSLLYVEDATKDASTSSVWIGKDLVFSNYEESQRAKFKSRENVKPTNVEKEVKKEEIKEDALEVKEAVLSEKPVATDEVNWDELDSI